jgi:hypothetical protein
MTTAAASGFLCEELIHTGCCGLTTHCMREEEIRSHFNDRSLNGVDHWISDGVNKHILVQDKWKETTTQHEVAQFLLCAGRIKERLPTGAEVYLLWASKKDPTTHAVSLLKENAVERIICASSPTNLAYLVVLTVARILEKDPIAGLTKIPVSLPPSTPMVGGGAATATATTTTATITELNLLIKRIQTEFVDKLRNYAMSLGAYDARAVIDSFLPVSESAWESFKKIDYNGLLKTLKKLGIPTRTKRSMIRYLNLYMKACYLSTIAGDLVRKYEALRAGNKAYPTIKWLPEHYANMDYRAVAPLCSDYCGGMEYDYLLHYNGN